MDVSQDDLFDAVDRIVIAALARAGISQPPVDALLLAESGFGFQIEFADDDPGEREYGQPGRNTRRRSATTILIREDMAEETKHLIAARAVARLLVPEVLKKVGITPGTEQKSATAQLVNLITPRLLLPTRWFSGDAGRAGYDVTAIREKYLTVNAETIALRLLDLDEPCLIAIVDDDGSIVARRSNRFQAPRKLTEAELACKAKIDETGEPARTKGAGWVVQGWPIPGVPFRRIVLRSWPEDV
jgi:hypothetical protein